MKWLGRAIAFLLERIWRFFRILWVCRAATLSAIGGGLLVAKLEQVRDLFSDTGLPWYGWVAFFVLLFIWAWLVHGMGRRALQFDEWVPQAHRQGGLSDEDRRDLQEEFYGLAVWIPRLLGLAVFAAVGWALYLSLENLRPAEGLSQVKAATSLIRVLLVATAVTAAVYLAFVSYWRDLRARLAGAPKEEPLLTGAQSVLLLACRAAVNWKEHGPALLAIFRSRLNRTLGAIAVFVTGVFVAAVAAPEFVSDWIPRVVILPVLLGSGILLFGEIASLSHRYATPLLVCFFILGGVLGWLLTHYNDVKWIPQAAGSAAASPTHGKQHQLDLIEAIKRWKTDNNCLESDCPRPIVIAGAGGASRAGFFTASVVGAMIDAAADDKEIGNIRSRIFALSTVSGSSVGAVMMRAAWMDALERGAIDKPPCREIGTTAWFRGDTAPTADKAGARPSTLWRDCFQKLMAGDFLSPVFVGLAYRDLFPLGYGADRSGLLEQSLERWYRDLTTDKGPAACGTEDRTGLCRQVGHLPDRADPTRPGDWIPLLFVNGTSVATGRRIIVSDVRIGCILDDGRGNRRRFLEFSYDYRELRDPGIRRGHDECADMVADPIGGDIDMRLSTVALMSARFPVISTQGVIRDLDKKIIDSVVDGGYFENDGLATAADIVRELQDNGLQPVVIRIVNEPDLKVDTPQSVAGTADDRAAKVRQAEARELSERTHRDGEYELVRPPLPDSEERTLFDTYTSIGRALYATRSGHEDGHLAYLRETLKGPLVRIGVGNLTPRPADSICRSPVDQDTSMKFVSMSWWMSQPVQAYLDAQLCRSQIERLVCVLKLKPSEGNDRADPHCD